MNLNLLIAGATTPVHASLNTGDCFKFHGGIHTVGAYQFFQLQNVHGEVNATYFYLSVASYIY